MQIIAKGLDLLQAGLITTTVFSVTVGLFAFQKSAPETIIEMPGSEQIVHLKQLEENKVSETYTSINSPTEEDDTEKPPADEIKIESIEEVESPKKSKQTPKKKKKTIKKETIKKKKSPNKLVTKKRIKPESVSSRSKEITAQRAKIRSEKMARLMKRKKMILKNKKIQKAKNERVLRAAITKKKKQKSAAVARKKAAKSKKCLPKPSDDILSLNAEEWLIARPLFERYLNDWALARKLAHLTWSKDKKGKTQGFKVKRIKCKSQLALLGIEKNDVIVEINGNEINGMSAALGLYWELRKSENLDIVVRRQNKTINLRYRVVG